MAQIDAMTDDELRRLAEAATPGPWVYQAEVKWRHIHYPLNLERENYIHGYNVYDNTGEIIGCDGGVFLADDAAFIAAANPDTVKRLLDEKRDLLRQLRDADAGWQPIATAPKDGRKIMFAGPFNLVSVCWWSERENGWMSDACVDFGGTEDATHWRPLPAPPEPTP